VILATAAAALALGAGQAPALTLRPCDVQTVRARCGTLAVPENRARPAGRKIRLRIVVVPARRKPVAKDAFAYLAGGPGGAATEATYELTSTFAPVNEHHDLLFVDQRGTGASNAFSFPNPKHPLTTTAQVRAFATESLKAFHGDPAQYGTRAAMDDLDAVRAALGYRPRVPLADGLKKLVGWLDGRIAVDRVGEARAAGGIRVIEVPTPAERSRRQRIDVRAAVDIALAGH